MTVAEHRSSRGYSVLDELTDVQIDLLLFLADRRPMPPTRRLPATYEALERRDLIARAPDDRDRYHVTNSGKEAVALEDATGRTASLSTSERADRRRSTGSLTV